MKLKQLIYYSIILMLIGCGGIKYKEKVLLQEELYFPSQSEESIARYYDCIEQMKKVRIEIDCYNLRPNDSLMEFTNQWYSKHLFKSNEPILYNQRDTGKKMIRFMHLKSWASPLSYRIENKNGEITYTYNKTLGNGGYIGEAAFEHEEKTVQMERWEKIMEQIEHIDFWNINTHDPKFIMDGEQWILEVLMDGKYHFVTRNTPAYHGNEAYAELCKLVRDAANDSQ